MLYNDRIYTTMLTNANDFYKKAMLKPDKMALRCISVQSWALKENCYEYLVNMLELFEKLYVKVDPQDFKFILA